MKNNRCKRGNYPYSFVERKKQNKQDKDEIKLSELWGLNSTLGAIISSYLREFKKASGYSGATPGSHSLQQVDGKTIVLDNGFGRWCDTLDKMIWSFEQYANMDGRFREVSEEYRNRLQEGIDLFAKYYSDLWY